MRVGSLPVVPARRSAPVDVVPVSHVARAILALDEAGAGRTFHLVAGSEAASVGELIDRAVTHLGGPPVRVVSPSVYRRLVQPLLERRAGAARKRWLRQGEVFFPYFSSRVRFASASTRAELGPLGVEVPALGDYFERLLDFAVDCSWGRERVGRAQALAAAPA